jgi:uncharacterized protein (TIRG00374 family)
LQRENRRESYHGYLGEKNYAGVRTRVLLAAITALTIGYLIWSLRDFKVSTLVTDLREMNWWWVTLAIASDVAVYVLQGVRWRLLLHPVEPVSLWQTVRAVYVGLFGNELIGFNAGEVVRCYLISRWTSLPFSVSLASGLIERIFDGFWLALAALVALKILPTHRHMRLLMASEYVLIGVVATGAILLGLAMFNRSRARAALAGKSWKRHLRVLIDDLTLIGHSRYLYYALFISLGYLLLQAMPIYASFKGYGFEDLGLKYAFAAAVVLRMGSAVPQAPGNIGIYIATSWVMKNLLNATPRDAENFAMVFWGIVTLRLIIGGAVTVFVTGAKFSELRRAAHAEHAELVRSRD